MPKITLRPQKVSDAKRFFEILTNPNFIFWGNVPKSLKDEIEFLKKGPQKSRKNIEHNYTILYGNEIVGGCGIKINQTRTYIGEIGYFIDEAFWGKGIATAATRLLEKIGFSKLKLRRIEIVMMPKNVASEKVAIKAGYKKEGVMRKALRKEGKYFDCCLHAKAK